MSVCLCDNSYRYQVVYIIFHHSVFRCSRSERMIRRRTVSVSQGILTSYRDDTSTTRRGRTDISSFIFAILFSLSLMVEYVNSFVIVSNPSFNHPVPTIPVAVVRTSQFRKNVGMKRLAMEDDSSSSSSSSSLDNPTITSSASSSPKTVPAGKVLQQSVILDGPEWQSVQNQLIRLERPHSQSQSQQPLYKYRSSSSGIYNIITGSVNGERMVGMQHLLPSTTTSTATATNDNEKSPFHVVTLDQDSSIQVYTDSIAYIPKEVSELDVIWTMIQSFSTIHCGRPILQNIGGASDTIDFVSQESRVVIVGNNPLALQIATIFRNVFQYNVTIVATSPLPTTTTAGGIQYLPPSVESKIEVTDEDDVEDSVLLGFATVMDQFDVLIDTIGNELSNSIIRENLKSNHNCHIYISTISESQRIILQNGLIFGPNQSKDHVQKVTTAATSTNSKNRPTYFPSPFGLGATVEAMLQKGILLKPQPMQNKNNNNVFVRSWSIKDFWEYTTWPRDATTSNSRFGFPSDVSDGKKRYYDSDLDDDDDDDDSVSTMISAPPLRSTYGKDMFRTKPENFEFEDDNDGDENSSFGSLNQLATRKDRYVIDVATVNDLQLIVQNQITCIVFVSAPFCRTCRYLKPQFVRMAREHRNTMNPNSDADVTVDSTLTASNNDSLLFIKAEAAGQIGKDIGRALGIDTVPTFILYKNGRRYGTPITSVTRLPSKDLDDTILALQQNRTVDFTTLFPTDASSMDDDNIDHRTNKNRSKLS